MFKDAVKNLKGHSVAMYSTWLYHKSSRILFDAGEGVSLSMMNQVFGIDKVFLSHGHYDHIGGLPGMIFARASARGDKEKPLTIYYPKGCSQVEGIRRFVGDSIGHISYDLKWIDIEPNTRIEAGKNLSVRSFKVEHTGLCLGYRLVEARKRLKPELRGKTGQEIEKLAREGGKDAVSDFYEHTVMAYCGDSYPVRPSNVAGADVLVHEATFLDVSERRGKNHSSAYEAMQVAKEAGVKALILMHISGRYPRNDVEKMVRDTVVQAGWEKPLAVLLGRRLIEIQ